MSVFNRSSSGVFCFRSINITIGSLCCFSVLVHEFLYIIWIHLSCESGFLNRTTYWLVMLMVLFFFPLENALCMIHATLMLLWWLPSTNSSHTSLLLVASLMRSSMTIKLGYLESINVSSFSCSGIPLYEYNVPDISVHFVEQRLPSFIAPDNALGRRFDH